MAEINIILEVYYYSMFFSNRKSDLNVKSNCFKTNEKTNTIKTHNPTKEKVE